MRLPPPWTRPLLTTALLVGFAPDAAPQEVATPGMMVEQSGRWKLHVEGLAAQLKGLDGYDVSGERLLYEAVRGEVNPFLKRIATDLEEGASDPGYGGEVLRLQGAIDVFERRAEQLIRAWRMERGDFSSQAFWPTVGVIASLAGAVAGWLSYIDPAAGATERSAAAERILAELLLPFDEIEPSRVGLRDFDLRTDGGTPKSHGSDGPPESDPQGVPGPFDSLEDLLGRGRT